MSFDRNSYGYKRLVVWQRAMALVVHVYNATKSFSKHEQYGLILWAKGRYFSKPLISTELGTGTSIVINFNVQQLKKGLKSFVL